MDPQTIHWELSHQGPLGCVHQEVLGFRSGLLSSLQIEAAMRNYDATISALVDMEYFYDYIDTTQLIIKPEEI